MLNKIANWMKDVKTIGLGVSAIALGLPMVLTYWEVIVVFINTHSTGVAISTFAGLLVILALTHHTIRKKEAQVNNKIDGIHNGLQSDIQQVSTTMIELHQESRTAHIKAEVDRIYSNLKHAEEVTENEHSYMMDLDEKRIKYKINSFSERRLNKLLEIPVKD